MLHAYIMMLKGSCSDSTLVNHLMFICKWGNYLKTFEDIKGEYNQTTLIDLNCSFKEISRSWRADAKRFSQRPCEEIEMAREDYEIRYDPIQLLA